MSCEELAPFLVDLARGAELPAEARARVAAHAAACAACGRRLEEEGVLSGELDRLAAEDEGAQAPVWIEARLREALRAARPATVTGRRRSHGWAWATAAAVAASAAAAGLLWRRAPTPTPAVEWAREAADGEDDAFLPVAFGDALGGLDAVQVVRVSLPRSAVGRLGLPLSNEPGQGPVEADVLVGQDGLPRAIRLVSLAPPAEGSRGNEGQGGLP